MGGTYYLPQGTFMPPIHRTWYIEGVLTCVFTRVGILHFAKHVPRLIAQKGQRKWQMRDDTEAPPEDVEGKTLLIAGYGASGKAVTSHAIEKSTIALSFLRWIACDHRPRGWDRSSA